MILIIKVILLVICTVICIPMALLSIVISIILWDDTTLGRILDTLEWLWDMEW